MFKTVVMCRYLPIVTILVLLSGCIMMDKKMIPPSSVYLTKAVQWQLPGTDILPSGNYVLTQTVQATYGKQTADLLFQVEKQQQRLIMAALMPSGEPLVQLIYDNGQISGQISPLVPAVLSLPHLVADFLLVYGEKQLLEQALASSGISLHQNSHERILRHRGEPIISVQYRGNTTAPGNATDVASNAWPTEATLQNWTLDYQLTIRTLSYTTL